jgi:hypothetical protein
MTLSSTVTANEIGNESRETNALELGFDISTRKYGVMIFKFSVKRLGTNALNGPALHDQDLEPTETIFG